MILTWVAVIVLASCGGRATPVALSTPIAAATPGPEAVSAIPATANPAPRGGGVSADEPTIVPLSATVVLSVATLLPAPPLPASTASPSVPSPTPEVTATRLPEPTATLAVAILATATPTATGAMATLMTTFPSRDPYPLQIEVMRQQSYPGSAIVIEQTLAPGANYNQYIVSYRSEGYKIYALMTVPTGPKPATGWPAIIFNHGYIPPAQYRTTERYVAYVDTIARSGYIVFKPDYRGHGSSEGPPEGGYGTPGYTNDVLNAMAAVKAYKDADPRRIGMWGHSMGGQLTLRAMVVSAEIKAGVIWGGVVASYPNIFARVTDPTRPTSTPRPSPTPLPPGSFGPYGRPWQQELTAKYGSSAQNPAFWASISPNSFLADISGPVQLHHSVTDEEVPVAASKALFAEMQAAGRPVELYTYPGDNHDIRANFVVAMQRTVAFFDKYVKG